MPPAVLRGRMLSLFANTYLGAILAAFEELGFFRDEAAQREFQVSEISKKKKWKQNLVLTACEYLVEMGVLAKKKPDTFEVAINLQGIRWVASFLLAHREVFESSSALLLDSKAYSREVIQRDETRRDTDLKNRGAWASIVPFLIERFNALNIKTAFEIGHEDGPEALSSRTDKVQAIIAIDSIHKFGEDKEIISTLKAYKKKFPTSLLFMAELDIPDWDNLRKEDQDPRRGYAAYYKIVGIMSGRTHRSHEKWRQLLQKGGWRLSNVRRIPPRLVLYECE